MKRILRRFPAFPVRMMMMALISLITMALFGCMGGGGGGVAGPGPVDRSLVAGRVQSLLDVLASGDGALLKGFLPSTLGDDIPDGGRFQSLFVHSFGNDLHDPADNATFTFFFDPNEITFPSSEEALAPVWTWLSTGQKLGIEIRLSKVGGEWFVNVINLIDLSLFQAAMTGGAVPSSALWPLARNNRWQFVEIQAPRAASVRPKGASRISAMLLNATRACLRTLETRDEPVPGPGGRQTFRLQMSVHESDLATSQLDLPLDPGTLEFGRFSNGISAIEWGFIPVPSGAVPGAQLWDILDPARQGSMRVFEQCGLYLQGGDTCFNGGLPWRLTDLLVQQGAAAMQNITLSIPGRGNRSGEARVAVMEPVQVILPWIQGLARRFDICLTWSGSAETTWTSLFFLPGMGPVGYAEYDLETRHPVRFAWLWGASVGGREYLPPGDTETLEPFITLVISPMDPQQWRVGTPFVKAMSAAGGQPPYAWSVSGSPAWVAIESATGMLSGTPDREGSYSFDVVVRDSADRVATLPVLADVSTPAPLTVTLEQASGQADPTSAATVRYTVTFSRAVSGFSAEDVSLGGTAAPTTCTVVQTAPNDGTTYDVAVSGMAGDGTVTAWIPANIAIDTDNNWNKPSTSADNQVTRDATIPTVTIAPAAGHVATTTLNAANFTVTFSEPVTGFANGDVQVVSAPSGANTTVLVTAVSPMVYTVTLGGMTVDGVYSLFVPANAAVDQANTGNLAAPSPAVVARDTVSPTVTINQAVGQADPTGGAAVLFNVVFSVPVTDFTSADVALSGTALPTTAVVTEIAPMNKTTYQVTVSGLTQDGTIVAAIPAGGVHDALGHSNLAGTSTDNVVTRDATAPTVAIVPAAGQVATTTLNTANFTVTFSEAVTGFANGDVQVVSAPPGANTTIAVTGVSPTVYTVTLGGMTIDGVYSLAVPANAAVDQSNSGNQAAPSPAVVARDTVSPAVTINQAVSQIDPTNSSSVLFDVVFSKPVTDFAGADVALGGTALPTTIAVTEMAPMDKTTYRITVSGMTGDGTIIAAIPAGVAHDALGNPSLAGTTTDNVVTRDSTSSAATINQAAGQADPANLTSALFDVVFSEPVTGFTEADVAISGTALPTTAVVTEIAPMNKTTYRVTVSGMSRDGTIIAAIPAGGAQDAAGNPNLAGTSTDNVMTRDTTFPTVTINQAAGQIDPTNLASVLFNVVFSEPVTGFTGTDVVLSGTAGATTATVSGSGTTYTVTVTNIPGEGTIIASIPAGIAKDAAGNPNLAGTTTDNVVTRDTTSLAVTINQAASQIDPTKLTSALFEVVFSKPVTDFTGADVALSGTALPTTVVVTEVAPMNKTTYQVTVSGMTRDGTIVASIPAGVVHDVAGNPNLAGTSTDNVVTRDTTFPTVTINQAAGQIDPTNLASVLFSVVFSEPVTGFTGTDVVLSGTAGATTATVSGSGTTYTVTVTNIPGEGTIIASIPAGIAMDAAGNPNLAGTTTDNVVTRDLTLPFVGSITTKSGTEIEVSFSTAMGTGVTNPNNYSISGDIGTLSTHPDSVTIVGDNIYNLKWNTGQMATSGTVTITVKAVKNDVGKPIGKPDSATAVITIP